ncbi:hypothetical protein LEP1GSC125_0566 [Leptospira mayottensis 200901122]|uniref:Uncharacterized protein n=1 Tax=Leptospira mayottensis 200901122 TaxID=1193010 RepID=A0AA87SYJ8_9LEPT|nr:hypothetical protein LEP1GSC125_0566 [Leptospira mayottensis 200901122]
MSNIIVKKNCLFERARERLASRGARINSNVSLLGALDGSKKAGFLLSKMKR